MDEEVGEVEGYAAAVPGPADRESFEAAQRRHRRASWRFTLLSGLGVLLMGVPMSAIVTPILGFVSLVIYDLARLVVVLPDPLRNVFESSASSPSPEYTPANVTAIALALILPGALAMLAAWLGVRALFGRHGAGVGVLALGARDPNRAVLEERQLLNVAAEMAVAAGVPPPAVKIIESDVPNAAVIGGSLDDATVVVTTGLLGVLDRDETQAVVGDLLASAGNGDLRIGVTIASLFQTLGVVASFLNAPWDRTSRRNIRRLFGLALRPRRRTPADIAAAGDLLAGAGGEFAEDSGKKAGCMNVITLPFLMAGGAFMMNRLIFGMLLVNPLLRRRWRARRYLADATAVELTRNPTALARALRALDGPASVPAGSEWASHLFVVGARRDDTSPRREPPEVTTFVAPVGERIARLERMGAAVEPTGGPPAPKAPRGCALVAFVLLIGPLLLFVAVVLFACALMLTAISLAIDMMFLGPAAGLVHSLLRSYAR